MSQQPLQIAAMSGETGRPQAIVAFHQDECGDWVADLTCGHTQHVRHRPPWELRPWVVTQEEREKRVGMMLFCRRCVDAS